MKEWNLKAWPSKWKYVQRRFLFFCKYNRISVSVYGLSWAWLLLSFCLKIGWNVHIDAFILENFIVFRKKENVIWFSVIKIYTPTNFMCLRSKLISEICQKVESFDGKMTQNRLKTCTFSFFSLKIITFKEKPETLFYFPL